jgi:hypothetical protein
MGEEKKRPIWLGCRAKRGQNLKDGYFDAANAGRDFVIKNVALDEGARIKVLYRPMQSRRGGDRDDECCRVCRPRSVPSVNAPGDLPSSDQCNAEIAGYIGRAP